MISGLQADLRTWAEWVSSRNGFSRSTVIRRAMAGQLNGGRGPIEHHADAMQWWLKELDIKISELYDNPKYTRYITAMAQYYLRCPEQPEILRGRPERTLRYWRAKGEEILKRELDNDATLPKL